ncbi:MAG: TolC family protein [Bacteroidota bacterium]|nr:TolC family protein [Bacteroidota bacterium]
MNLIKRILSSLIISFTIFSGSFSQEVYRLDLETSILLAQRQSNRMLILKQQLKSATYNLKIANSQFKTHINLDMTLPQYTETIRQWEDSSGISFYPVRQNQINSYLTINQPLPTDGSLYIRTGLLNFVDFYADDRNAQISSSIGLRQPIAAFFGHNNIKLFYKQAKLNYEMTLKQLKRDELDLVYITSQAFYGVLSAQEAMEIARRNLERQQEAFTIARNKYKAGLIREVEALQMEVDLSAAANQYENARTDNMAQFRLFKEQLGLNMSDSVVVQNEMEYKPIFVNVDKAVGLAMANRLELRENEIRIELQEMEVRRRKAAGRISGDILLNYNFIGVGKNSRAIPIATTFDNTWQNLTDRPGSFGVGLTARIPILDWGENRARVNYAKSGLEQNKLQLIGTRMSIEREIRTLVDRLHNSLRGLELLEKSVIIAEKSFDISRQRYANGEIDSQFMALERDRLNQAYTTKLNSYINYKLSLSDLMRKTFFDFEANKPVVPDSL